MHSYSDNATGAEKRDFVLEIDLMKKITEGGNSHVVNMLCAVTIQEPLCIVSEFVEHGDLLEYLKACKKQVCSVPTSFFCVCVMDICQW